MNIECLFCDNLLELNFDHKSLKKAFLECTSPYENCTEYPSYLFCSKNCDYRHHNFTDVKYKVSQSILRMYHDPDTMKVKASVNCKKCSESFESDVYDTSKWPEQDGISDPYPVDDICKVCKLLITFPAISEERRRRAREEEGSYRDEI